MFTDVHCHILSNYYWNIDNIIDELNENNIKRIIVNGYNKASNEEVLKLVSNNNVYGALGIHPDNIDCYNFENKKLIEENLKNDKIIAIGEIGLDFYHNKENKEEQIEMFEYFLSLAEKYKLPVIIHSRDATDTLIKILKSYNCFGVIHCFSGSYETACEYIKMGYKLGIGGVVTFKNSNLSDVLKKIPIENILLETDSPYLTPEPLRGTYNNPFNVNFVARYLAELYNISLDELSNILEKNYVNTFNK